MASIVLTNPRFDPSFRGLEHTLALLDVKANLPVAALPLTAALTWAAFARIYRGNVTDFAAGQARAAKAPACQWSGVTANSA